MPVIEVTISRKRREIEYAKQNAAQDAPDTGTN